MDQKRKEIQKKCKSGRFYMSRFLGGNGEPDTMIDTSYRPYKYVETLGLGVFRCSEIWGGKLVNKWYQLPQYFSVKQELSEAEVMKWLEDEASEAT